MISRVRGLDFPGSSIKKFNTDFIERIFDSYHHRFTAQRNLLTIHFLESIISEIETEVKSQIQLKKEFQVLLTTPGIGNILGLTIMLEVGDINRFEKVGNYSSYCRCVDSKKISNKKKKGENNKKNGNRYLAWAYVEAANHAVRVCQKSQRFFQRKMSKTSKNGRTLAIKALANKLSKATYFIMRDQVPYDAEKLFR
jgi:transposase